MFINKSNTMKKVLLGGSLLVILAITLYAFVVPKPAVHNAKVETAALETPIKWYTWEEALEANKKVKKKMFLDMYTDWCGWCKKMDASTFKDPKVTAVMNKYFYAVKFDAEQKKEIKYGTQTFKYVAQGSRGVHELAYALLDGQLGYPSFVYLNEKQERVTVSPGYKTPEQIIPELEFIGAGLYTKMDYQAYLAQQKK